MSTIFDLPNEVLFEIGKCLESEKDISSLVRTCQLFHDLLDDYLYHRNVSRGAPGLFYCAEHGLENSTKRLLELQSKRKMKNSLLYRDKWLEEDHPGDPGSPLYTAIVSHQASIVRIILSYVVKKRASRMRVFAPLYDAIFWSTEAVVREILEWGKDMKFIKRQKTPALCLALREKNLELVKLLLEYGACLNPPLPLPDCRTDRQGIIGDVPLKMAMIVDRNDFRMSELLLSYGADVNFQEEDGITQLHLATLSGDVDDVRWLLNNGADPRIVTDRGLSALDMAKRDPGLAGEELTKLYLEFGSEVEREID